MINERADSADPRAEADHIAWEKDALSRDAPCWLHALAKDARGSTGHGCSGFSGWQA